MIKTTTFWFVAFYFMELKANECRYGNFIIGTYESEDDNLVHETICEFKFYDCYNNYYNVESKERIEEFTGFKPIPLTEEWLLKFGFINDKVLEFYRNDFTDSTIIIDYNFICLLGYSHVKLNYVHELQNLYFALTGSELTVA